MMVAYTTKDKVPAEVVYLPAEQQKHGDLYMGSLDGVSYLDHEKRGKEWQN